MSDANENAGQETLGERRQGAEMQGVSDTLLQSEHGEHGEWRRVCAISVLPEQAGRSAWLDGRSLALFRLGERVYALDDLDPLAGVAVLSRGLVGDCGGEPVVASPLYKQRYALMDGRCLDDPTLSVACWPVRLDGGEIWVQLG
ncbi:nitrite reductase small subunit NirD [Aeromonas salmonicida]|uniref:nitrite reductase small subunit NirD n=1 Tax=Aeromonas salmonicida TaxID=645 RepID=UPI003D007D48